MLKISFSRILVLAVITVLLVLMLASNALACSQEGKLQGRHQFSVMPRTPRVLAVNQNGQALLIEVRSGDSSRWLDQANDRAGPEVVVLEAGRVESNVEVCIYSRHRNSPGDAVYEIQDITELATDSVARLDTFRLFSEAGELWASGEEVQQADAISMYESLANVGPELFPFRDFARVYLVTALFANYEYGAALENATSFLEEGIADPRIYFQMLFNQGITLLRLRRFEQAAAVFESAMPLAATNVELALLRTKLAEAVVSLDRIQEGADLLQEALKNSSSDFSLLVGVHNTLGFVHLRSSYDATLSEDAVEASIRTAINEHLIARAFAQNADAFFSLQLMENNLGTLYERVGEYRKANYHFRESLRLAEETGDLFNARLIYQNLGSLNLNLGDYLKSTSYLERSKTILEQVQASITPRIQCRLGANYRLLQRLEEAIAAHEECNRLAQADEQSFYRIQALTELALDYEVIARRQGLVNVTAQLQNSGGTAAESAWAYISAARDLVAERAADRPALNAIFNENRTDNTNLCTRTEGSPLPDRLQPISDGTLEEYETAIVTQALIAFSELAIENDQEQEGLRALSTAHLLSKNSRNSHDIDILRAAIAIYRSRQEDGFLQECERFALAYIESMHEDLEAERNGPAWSAKTHEVYIGVAERLLEKHFRGNPDLVDADESAVRAFEISERSRAISLRQHLSLPASDFLGSATQQLNESISRIADQHASLNQAQKSMLMPSQYYHQQDLLELSRINRLDSIPVPPPLDLAAIRTKLDENQKVLFYLMAAQTVYLFELSLHEFSVSKLGTLDALLEILQELEPSMRGVNSFSFDALLRASNFLLPENLTLIENSELIIVPHRNLNSAPFSALAHPDAGGYQPLISSHTIKVVPSLTTLFMEKPSSEPDFAADIAIFADPIFGDYDKNLLASNSTSEVLEAGVRSWSAGLERLPYTEQEAQAITSIFTPDRTLEFLQNRATLENLRNARVRNSRILHIATHGYFRSTNSDNVGLVLSAVDEDNEPIANFVTLTELFSHRFNNQLVVISGCDTAMGMQYPGEGMNGLTRGFIAQGAKNVVSTLWPVNDRASYVFMSLLYENLLLQGSIAEALRSAQNQLREMPQYRNPYYWAPYVLTTITSDGELALQ